MQRNTIDPERVALRERLEYYELQKVLINLYNNFIRFSRI
jgi:hypothetical protein